MNRQKEDYGSAEDREYYEVRLLYLKGDIPPEKYIGFLELEKRKYELVSVYKVAAIMAAV